MKNLAPIVLFVYNRPWHTKQTIEALQKNELASDSELFIYSDGAKNEDAVEKVNEVREYIKTIDGFKNITIIERDKNWGLADSIIDGVTNLVNQYGKIIVLEDDIVTSPYFLKFMNDALEFYVNEEKVVHVSSYLYPKCDNTVEADTYFVNIATCWGWGTWKRAWRYFEYDCDKLLEEIKQEDICKFNLNSSYNWYEHLVLNANKKMKTWAIRWYASFFKQNGYSLHPRFSLTKNIGNDGSGVHCGSNDIFTQQPILDEMLKVEKIELKEDKKMIEKISIFFKKGN